VGVSTAKAGVDETERRRMKPVFKKQNTLNFGYNTTSCFVKFGQRQNILYFVMGGSIEIS
jgi:hypothetical protein